MITDKRKQRKIEPANKQAKGNEQAKSRKQSNVISAKQTWKAIKKGEQEVLLAVIREIDSDSDSDSNSDIDNSNITKRSLLNSLTYFQRRYHLEYYLKGG